MNENQHTGLSVSFRIDDGIIEHNNRSFIAKNVVRERIPDNITYKKQNIREFYSELFGEALAEYNSRMKRRDRIIPDYYEHIRKGKQEKTFEEIVVQFGDINDCSVGSKQMLDQYMRGFETRNPNLKVFNAVMHLDEATPHLHIDFVPITHTGSRGLSTRVSMSGALREMGFAPENKFLTEWVAWSDSERAVMEKILREHGLYRDIIALDIDRLVYSSTSVENLLSKLKEHGYEIKHGKYIAVKAPFAERYVRLKSLGDEYLPKMLERRISLNGTYARKVRERMSRSSEMEKKICSVILDTTVAIQQFRIIPKKTKPQKIYTFSNDESLNMLVELLSTIGEFGITSGSGIYAKAEKLKNSIDEKSEELKILSDEVPTLKSEIAQIRFFFENVQNRRRLDSMGQVKLAAAKEAVDKHGIRSENDVTELEERLKLLPSYIRTVQNKLAEKQAGLKRINRLADVYESVIEGNYIDNLIREKKEQEHRKKS